ncbi:hypothetical protein Micbo1qcDRAFT_181454 [Microdochium bolleyi]|uniref:Uncharacterized protein n=1 Tax=Microdochium bolleyi TaxID=196109 RepID=A0A136IJ62_9PEZI|nr:hypothetical protein Micbo1qcDRAFT_181454 [Microdochium bolleyi]
MPTDAKPNTTEDHLPTKWTKLDYKHLLDEDEDEDEVEEYSRCQIQEIADFKMRVFCLDSKVAIYQITISKRFRGEILYWMPSDDGPYTPEASRDIKTVVCAATEADQTTPFNRIEDCQKTRECICPPEQSVLQPCVMRRMEMLFHRLSSGRYAVRTTKGMISIEENELKPGILELCDIEVIDMPGDAVVPLALIFKQAKAREIRDAVDMCKESKLLAW